MEEIKKEDVIDAPPSEEVAETPQQEATPQEEVVEPSETPEVKPEVRKDDRPIENVAWEVKRKLDETIPMLQQEIRDLKTHITEGRQQTPTYTKAQLQAYASDPTTTTEQRLWAYTEVDKLEKEDRRKEYETLVTSTRKNTESEGRKAQSANWVAQTFPDTVVKDQTGNPLGWNNSSPLYQKANEYMSRSENLRNDPEGFMAAVKMAAFDLGITPTTNKKIDRTVAQLRKEQKKQLASAGGTRPAETPANATQARYEKLKKTYAETGDRNAFAEMLKIRGQNPFAT